MLVSLVLVSGVVLLMVSVLELVLVLLRVGIDLLAFVSRVVLLMLLVLELVLIL